MKPSNKTFTTSHAPPYPIGATTTTCGVAHAVLIIPRGPESNSLFSSADATLIHWPSGVKDRAHPVVNPVEYHICDDHIDRTSNLSF